ncbi:MAG: FliM/FliN family flagellar motor switch protein [Spirochaetales bacterium]|nr:FliM/FliN family flagellar motor switch protein [Spirochaetales bacterium]
MSEVLSQQEIDRLLSCLESSNQPTEETSDNRKIRTYDFKRPDILRRYQISDLHNLCEIMAQSLALIYTKYHKKDCHITVSTVDILTIEEYYRCLPSPTFLYKFDYGGCIGCVDISAEMMMRGFLRRKINYNACIKIKEFDQFDIEVCKQFVIDPLLQTFRSTMQSEVSETLPPIGNIQYLDRPKEYYYADMNESGALITMEMKLGEETSLMNLFLPKKMTELLIKQEVLEMRKRYVIQDGEPLGNAYVRLGSRTINDEMKKDIKIGSIVELNTLAGEPLELYVDDKPFARGDVVVVDEKFALRITEMTE